MTRALPLVLLLALACASHRVGYRDGTWYPAAEGGSLLRFRDYIPRLEDWDMRLSARGFSEEQIVELFDTQMQARGDAPALAQTFPRLRIALRDDEVPGDYAVIAELLASHGYIVTLNDDSSAQRIDVSNLTTLHFRESPAAARRAASRLLRSIDK